MIKYIILLSSFICMNIFAQGSNADALKKVDLEFSNLSKEKGVKEAFLVYTAENGVLLRPFMMPVVGYDEVKKFMEEGDNNFQLTWEPVYADVSASGEMGYTYGLYTAAYKDEKGVEQSTRGTYVSIWKKDKDGNWKFVLDTGNPGLEPRK
ncbi:MAG TPA: DUF4440 domain-containing protein [Ignavibacteria bacterium]|nr:hypothetical protein [Bacteroidota bacterium]HRE12454.1 DUF4440 domain-containing protein [Ignavibacteria bacterium]HRF65739.1 DUF4440 domain-containing protein [Ignavibacteria bacterium]HRJ87024.1 DUF4440 domain-containing protein [Ignavibacteria bacterium]